MEEKLHEPLMSYWMYEARHFLCCEMHSGLHFVNAIEPRFGQLCWMLVHGEDPSQTEQRLRGLAALRVRLLQHWLLLLLLECHVKQTL